MTDVKKVRSVLQDGDIICYPTETVWGLGADIQFEKAQRRIFEIKKRTFEQSLSLLVRDIMMARHYGEWAEHFDVLFDVFWPGPITFVVKATSDTPKYLSQNGTIGLRCSSHAFVRELMSEYPRPITTTSVNRTTEPPARRLEELQWLPEDVVKIQDSTVSKGKGSTVARLMGKTVEILREGDLPTEKFLRMCKTLGTQIKLKSPSGR